MPGAGRSIFALLALTALLWAGAPAAAAVPANDAPAGAAFFEAYTAANGAPKDLQAIAELVDATADAGVPRCLGRSSFERTAWYRIPAAASPQEIAVEGFGRTLDVVDLAAFVQPLGAPAPSTLVANACGGLGSGGADAADEPTSGVALRVPAGHDVLLQAGRRGAVGSADDERVLLSLDARPLPALAAPPGDTARQGTPAASSSHATFVSTANATVTEEDPALPACPALGTVWRRYVPGSTGPRVISVSGPSAHTLAVFRGRLPASGRALDCVNRARYGALEMRMRVRRRKPVWIRIGTNRPGGGPGVLLRVADGRGATVIDGGPGGFDPTTGGPGGGLPSACDRAAAERARVRGRFTGFARGRRPVSLRLRVRGSSACDAWLTLVGPGGDVYAQARAVRLHGRERVRLELVRALRGGRYRLRVTARSQLGGQAKVRSNVRGRLR